MTTKAMAAITRSRSRLILTQPFWGTLALYLDLQETSEIPTMATNGKVLLFNPDFTLSLTEQELGGVVAHEVCHCAYFHPMRRQNRDPLLFNVACDYAVNRDLLDAGFKLPKGHLFDRRFDGMGAEEIYRILLDEQEKQQQASGGSQSPEDEPNGSGQSQGQGSGKNAPAGIPASAKHDPGRCGGVFDAAPGHDHAEQQRAEQEWQCRIRQAVAIAKTQNAGRIPADLLKLVESLNAPRIDWRQELRRFTDESSCRDFSWMRPNRRHLSSGQHLPGLVPDRPNHIVVIDDTSGSVYNDDSQQAFASEMQGMIDDGACDRITVVYADTEVHGFETFESGDLIRLDAKGGGGTDYRQPLAWVGENIPDASAIVFLTDCFTSDWGDEPAVPLLWAVCGQKAMAQKVAESAPFGEAVYIGD